MIRTPQSFISKFIAFALFVLFARLWLSASDHIPVTAWRIPIGQPPANPGGRKHRAYQHRRRLLAGAPVVGFGAGTFSRSYRGNFERWHIKAGVHKYQNVPANQFAVFVQPEGEPAMAQVLSTGKPEGGALSCAGTGHYPAGRRRVRRALSQIMVRVPLASASRQFDHRTILAHSAQQL